MSGYDTVDNIVVYITAPSENDAVQIAKALVESKLAACVNIIHNIRSIYSWQGTIEDDSELMMIVKTKKAAFISLSERVKELHPYDVPEIIALPIVDGSEEYLHWIKESTS